MGTHESECCISGLHVFLFSFPSQTHFIPFLKLAKTLASKGLFVTLSTTQLIGKEIEKSNNIVNDQPIPVGKGFIRFEFFEDEWNSETNFNIDLYSNHLELVGRRNFPKMLKNHEEQGRPVSCLIFDPFISWVSNVAASLGFPTAMFWVQSCASFSAYYHYYHGSVPFPTEEEPKIDVKLPGMPLLKHDELPSSFRPTATGGSLPFVGNVILGLFKNLNLKNNFCILIDTFQELEDQIVGYMSKLCPVKSIGPLFRIPEDWLDSNNIRGDIIKPDISCKDWLDSKPESSVLYISFGSLAVLKQDQVTEIAHGLLNSGVSFLWVMRPPPKTKNSSLEPHVLPDAFWEKAGDKGKIVQWSPQEQVLAHPSVSSFVTHCGWKSTLEALASGVPVVAFPLWGDQHTNAMFLVDEFKVGIRLSRGHDENRVISREEIEKCFREATSTSPKAAEIKENALKWKNKAADAVEKGGSSDRNIHEFLDEVIKRCTMRP